MTSKSLTPRELLPLDARNEVEHGGEQQEHRCRDQAGPPHDDAQPLDETHDSVHRSAHVISREATHKFVEFRRCRADPEKQGYFEENKDETRDAGMTCQRQR